MERNETSLGAFLENQSFSRRPTNLIIAVGVCDLLKERLVLKLLHGSFVHTLTLARHRS